MNSALKLDAVSKTYQRGAETVHALQAVSLDVRQGEFVALVGPSGSGKSTALHLMGCMDQPSSGEIHVGDRAVSGLDDAQRAHLRRDKIGFVFQQFFLLPTLTALENVQLPTVFSGKQADGRTLLARVGLEGRDQHRPSQLSGGEMQRVAIARALVNRPEILLADEPTGNLDTLHASEIFGLFRALSREHGLTVVVVTHNNELAALTDRVIRLKDGRVAFGDA